MIRIDQGRSKTGQLRSQYSNFVRILLALLLFVTACSSGAINTPRSVDVTTGSTQTQPPTPETIVLVAPTATPDNAKSVDGGQTQAAVRPSISVWIGHDTRLQLEAVEKMAADFSLGSGIQVDAQLIPERLLPALVQTSVISGTLPDIIILPIEYGSGWAEQGILDSQAATMLVRQLGEDTFDQGALRMLSDKEEGIWSAVPSDGWQQLILYRTDWFSERNLLPPDRFATILEAADSIFGSADNVAGIVIPTDSALVSTQQVFEFIASADGCQLLDREGQVGLLHPACLHALDFYRALVNSYSPIGVQTDNSVIDAYLEGRVGLILATPTVLPLVFGISQTSLRSCAACPSPEYLSDNTGIIRQLTGDSDFASPANFGQVTSLGITTAAQTELASKFAEYWFTDGYLTWLAASPESKTPMRLGSTDDSQRFIDAWRNLAAYPNGPSLSETYGDQTIELISTGITESGRWGLQVGQGSLTAQIYEELTFSPLLQDMLSGYFTSSQTIIEMNDSVIRLLPEFDLAAETASDQG